MNTPAPYLCRQEPEACPAPSPGAQGDWVPSPMVGMLLKAPVGTSISHFLPPTPICVSWCHSSHLNYLSPSPDLFPQETT